jgi:hypothetical protein
MKLPEDTGTEDGFVSVGLAEVHSLMTGSFSNSCSQVARTCGITAP